jgi:hypothetical protein
MFYSRCTKAMVGITYQGKEGTELIYAVYKSRKLGFILKKVMDTVHDWGKFQQN